MLAASAGSAPVTAQLPGSATAELHISSVAGSQQFVASSAFEPEATAGEMARWSVLLLKTRSSGSFCRLADRAAPPAMAMGSNTSTASSSSGVRITRRVPPPAAPLRAKAATDVTLTLICDRPTAADAAAFVYTGTGLAYMGQPLVATGPQSQLQVVLPAVVAKSIRYTSLHNAASNAAATVANLTRAAATNQVANGPSLLLFRPLQTPQPIISGGVYTFSLGCGPRLPSAHPLPRGPC
jgi:hypothetical protein